MTPRRERMWVALLVVGIAWVSGGYSAVLIVSIPAMLFLTQLGEGLIVAVSETVNDKWE